MYAINKGDNSGEYFQKLAMKTDFLSMTLKVAATKGKNGWIWLYNNFKILYNKSHLAVMIGRSL